MAAGPERGVDRTPGTVRVRTVTHRAREAGASRFFDVRFSNTPPTFASERVAAGLPRNPHPAPKARDPSGVYGAVPPIGEAAHSTMTKVGPQALALLRHPGHIAGRVAPCPLRKGSRAL